MSRLDSIVGRWPSFLQAGEPDSVLRRFVASFATALDEAEADLVAIMRAHWVDTANNEGSQGFNTARKGDLDKLFSLCLENLGGTSELKQTGRPDGPGGEASDASYRERIRGLISILRNGASTREGIVAIVAANLGVVGDTPEARAARDLIRVVEFQPEVARFDRRLLFGEEFSLENPNPIPADMGVRVQIAAGLPLRELSITNLTTGGLLVYRGALNYDDILSIFPDGTAVMSGVSVALQGDRLVLPPGPSHWRIDAEADPSAGDVHPIGAFDASDARYDGAVFEFEQAFQVSISFEKLTPGSFMVRIPWDIPGYTEKLDKLADSPRNQIPYIVRKVRAAGVTSAIAYEKHLREVQEMAATLTLVASRHEEHSLAETNFDIGAKQSGAMVHELSDALTLSGVFDMTGFDTLNTFAP